VDNVWAHVAIQDATRTDTVKIQLKTTMPSTNQWAAAQSLVSTVQGPRHTDAHARAPLNVGPMGWALSSHPRRATSDHRRLNDTRSARR